MKYLDRGVAEINSRANGVRIGRATIARALIMGAMQGEYNFATFDNEGALSAHVAATLRSAEVRA